MRYFTQQWDNYYEKVFKLAVPENCRKRGLLAFLGDDTPTYPKQKIFPLPNLATNMVTGVYFS